MSWKFRTIGIDGLYWRQRQLENDKGQKKKKNKMKKRTKVQTATTKSVLIFKMCSQ